MKIFNINKITLLSLCSLSLLATANTASAALVEFSIMGEITSNITNPFGLSNGDIVSATGVFDDAAISATGESIVSFADATNNMVITIGNQIYTDDLDFLGGGDLFFFDGMFDGIDYQSVFVDGVEYETDAGIIAPVTFDSWGYLDFTGSNLEGNWIANSYQVSAVPVPAAVWLFGSGLALLAGMGRRFKQKAL